MFEREARDLAHVQRWGILRRVRQQSVAEHSFYVTLYAQEIAMAIGWKGDMGKLLHAALVADLPEIWTGDMPGPSKRAIVDPEKLRDLESGQMRLLFSEHESAYADVTHDYQIMTIVKVADMLEAVLYLCDESNLGNKSVGGPYDPGSPLHANFERLRVQWSKLLPLVDDPEPIYTTWAAVGRAMQKAETGLSRIVLDPKE